MRISGVSPGGEEGRAGRACEESSLLGQGHGEEEEAGRRNSAEPLSSLLFGRPIVLGHHPRESPRLR